MTLQRFKATRPDPDRIVPIPLTHSAISESRTIYPRSVVSAEKTDRLLVSGRSSRKLGAMVTKGKWRGFPIYHLSLEERATCPRSCFHWTTCFGNAMPFARRHSHGGGFIQILESELSALQRAHPNGFVVRLHNLGDFFSVEYVQQWGTWLAYFRGLHAFGYSAWQPETPIGAAIVRLRGRSWSRFAIRTSDGLASPNAMTIWREPESKVVPEGIVCPAETGASACCGTCTLCWSAPSKTIVFVAHGKSSTKGVARGTAEDLQAREQAILALWRGHRHTIDDIVAELGVKRRTVETVLGMARDAGAITHRRPGKIVSSEATR